MSAAFKCDSCGSLVPHRENVLAIKIEPWNLFHVCASCFKLPMDEVIGRACMQEAKGPKP